MVTGAAKETSDLDLLLELEEKEPSGSSSSRVGFGSSDKQEGRYPHLSGAKPFGQEEGAEAGGEGVMRKDVKVFIEHILESISIIESYTLKSQRMPFERAHKFRMR